MSLKDFIVSATKKAMDELIAAFLKLPEDKRDWTPEATSRSAVDMVVECALLSGYTSETLKTHTITPETFQKYPDEKKEAIAQGWEAIHARLEKSVARFITALQEVPDGDLDMVLEFPWGKMTLAELAAYPYWNMSYHQGQINYIASMLGCLE